MKTQTIRQRLLRSTMFGGAALLALTAVPAMTLLAPTTAMAQSQTGSLRVTVTDGAGQPLVGAAVKVASADSLISRSAVTDEQGRARLTGLDPATNYTVEVTASGHDAFIASSVAVVSGRELAVGYALGAATLDDVIVTGASLAAVDVTSATVGTTLTLDIVESLPTGRSYQSYLQLVPGVMPSSGGNPASRSGSNYADMGGVIGQSTDNVYYLDGVDVTDHTSGTFGTNFNSEIIQEQQALVGGVPAEFGGGSGLISSVISKSGSNEWSGSVNYYLQNDGLVAQDEHNTSKGFSTYDTAFTFGGPILKDSLWFFSSYQKTYREDEVVNPNTGALVRTVEREAEYAFLKATWQITDNDRVTAVYFSDPTEISGSALSTTLNNRDSAIKQGGENYKVDYTRSWGDFLFNAYMFKHEGELSTIAADQSIRNTVTFQNTSTTNVQRALGGLGSNLETFRNREEIGLNLEYYLDTTFGSHTVKGGYSSTENVYEEDSTVPGGATYTSISTVNSGVTFSDVTTGTGWTARSIATEDRARILGVINGSADRAYYLTLLDSNNDGAVSVGELDAYRFTSTADNPYGQVNSYRSFRAQNAPYSVSVEGTSFYLQDSWTLNQLTINAGVRAERWVHNDSAGNELFTFDWEYAPRLSAVYDMFGDGRTKVFGFVGRYYDPIRSDKTDFAGALTGPVSQEQMFLGDRWLTYRTRGGAVIRDSIFAPSTKTPYTDEMMLGASTTFGSDIVLSTSITSRKTRDIFEDFDLAVYSDPNGDPDEGHAHEGSSLYLPLSYFGLTSIPTNVNYVLGTLPGGKRDYLGFEVTLQKFKTDNWQGMISYTNNDAWGNTSSDASADFAGDAIFLDPRAPNVWAPSPGSIRHQIKAFASYEFDFGLEVSSVFNWNSGALYTPGYASFSRYLPEQVEDAYEFEGITANWVAPNSIGSAQAPSYYTLDMRLKYVKEMPVGDVEFFLDVFNVLNQQSATSEMSLVAGNGVYDLGEADNWVAPRRAYLGVRYAF